MKAVFEVGDVVSPKKAPPKYEIGVKVKSLTIGYCRRIGSIGVITGSASDLYVDAIGQGYRVSFDGIPTDVSVPEKDLELLTPLELLL